MGKTPNPRRGAIAGWGMLLFSAAAVLLAAYLLFTADAAARLTQLVLRYRFGLRQVELSNVQGSLLQGFSAQPVRIRRFLRKYPAAELDVAQASMKPLFSWKTNGPSFAGSGLRLLNGPLAQEITAERAAGSALGGIAFEEVRFIEMRRLPKAATLDVQRLESGWPIGKRKLRLAQNGRLRLPQSEPVVFSASRQGKNVQARLFSRALDAQDVLGLLPNLPSAAAAIRGAVSDADLSISGTDGAWNVDGTFKVDHLSSRRLSMAKNAGRMSLQIIHAPWQATGRLLYWGGTLTAREVNIDVRPSMLSFAGDFLSPTLDLNGSASVGTTQIRIHVAGTKATPKLILTSEPPMAQETLLLMLVTGKSWQGARQALAQGEISSELATDFIDYVFFGGLGNRISRRFGITDFAITQNPESNTVGAQATFADRMTLDVQVDPTGGDVEQAQQPADARQPLPYRVGAEYQVTGNTSIRVEGESSPVEQKQVEPAAGDATAAQAGPEVDNTILLKVKRRF